MFCSSAGAKYPFFRPQLMDYEFNKWISSKVFKLAKKFKIENPLVNIM